MSILTKVKLWFTPKRTLREQVERAYGLWLAGPREINAVTFISNLTGIPHDEVWGIYFGRNSNG